MGKLSGIPFRQEAILLPGNPKLLSRSTVKLEGDIIRSRSAAAGL